MLYEVFLDNFTLLVVNLGLSLLKLIWGKLGPVI